MTETPREGSQPTLLDRLAAAGRWAEDAVLVAILAGMILLAAGQILLRNAFDVGFYWTDEALRLMVLWLTVAGAVAASRGDRHLNIAILDRFLPDRVQRPVKRLLHAFTAAVCGLIAWHAFRFVRTSHEFGDMLLGGVPAWVLQSVLPIGFGLMAWRYALQALGPAPEGDGKRVPGK